MIYNFPKVINQVNLQPIRMNNNLNSTRHCFSCGKQVQSDGSKRKLQKHQYPVCNQKSDLISLQKHYMCEVCVCAFESIKNFVNKYELRWFNGDFELNKIIDSNFIKMSHFESSFTKQNKRKSQLLQHSPPQQQGPERHLSLQLNLPNDIYSAVINDNIQSEDLHHVYWLPKTVQYLIQLTAVTKMRPEQRRQRVKKTLQALSYIYCIDQSDLKYLAIIVQTLYCYMNQQALLKIIDRLLKGFLQNNVPMELFLVEEVYQIQKSFEDKHLHKKPIQFRPDKLLYLIFSIFILLDFFKDGKLHRHISEIVHLSHQELTKSKQQPTIIEKTLQQYLKSIISDNTSKLTKPNPSSWEQLVDIKRQKNHLNLIMKTIKKQHQENQQIIKDIETKFKKQKDQYINKIVKLHNQIEALETELKNIKQGENLTKNNNRIIRLKDEDEEVKSNPQLKTIDVKQNKNQPITERTEIPSIDSREQFDIKKHKSEIETHQQPDSTQTQQTLTYLKTILQITDIIAFNAKYLKKTKNQSISFPLPEVPNTLKQLSQVIITEIDGLEKKVTSLLKENKKSKEETTRLLAILKRKEESWLPLLHQKDQIISLYQKALICLEKGYILPEQPLSSRIQAIMEKVSKIEFIRLQAENDDISVRNSGNVANSFVQELPEEFIPPLKSQKLDKQPSSLKKTPAKKDKYKKTRNFTSQKIDENKIKRMVKKDKERQSQCLIY